MKLLWYVTIVFACLSVLPRLPLLARFCAPIELLLLLLLLHAAGEGVHECESPSERAFFEDPLAGLHELILFFDSINAGEPWMIGDTSLVILGFKKYNSKSGNKCWVLFTNLLIHT